MVTLKLCVWQPYFFLYTIWVGVGLFAFFQTDCIPFISEMSCHVTFVTVDLESRMLFLGISWASMDQF